MFNSLIDDFEQIIGFKIDIPKKILSQLEKMTEEINADSVSFEKRKENLIKILNEKLELNKETYKNIIDYLASQKVYFNYHEKLELESLLNSTNKIDFYKWLKNKKFSDVVKNNIEEMFLSINFETTIDRARERIESETVDSKKSSIQLSLFGSYVFHSYPIEVVHQYFSGDSGSYKANYYNFLRNVEPEHFPERKSLSYVVIDGSFESNKEYNKYRNSIISTIKHSYSELVNHSFLAIQVKPLKLLNKNMQWDIFSDVVLFSEKFLEVKLDKSYFKPETIKNVTSSYIEGLDVEKARFDISNEGFTYIDCFVLTKNNIKETSSGEYDILILLQKNERDERVVPCPACRTYNVRGNSYPKINVKSWECQNPFCPDRSLYNRGKRYSFESIIKQEAILNEKNNISDTHLKKWRFDISKIEHDDEVLELLVRHYTLEKDIVSIYDSRTEIIDYPKEYLDRTLISKTIFESNEDLIQSFYDSPLFKRFMVKREYESVRKPKNLSDVENVEIYCADSFEAISSLEENSIDGAVTSPPYYNAKQYAQWENMYNYLYDMYNITGQVHRVLKPGSVYLFNIFDYFDNEKTLVFSDMGKKRMILGAYIIHLFKSLGFVMNGNIIWNKGEIEGKRNFNQGNNSPYYQAPFNSWEHVFIFSKDVSIDTSIFPSILYASPVKKIFKGKNILGHDAPFPEEIPALLVSNLRKGQTVLEPFAGSFTTAVVAKKYGVKSVNIDYKQEYCELGLDRLKKEEVDLFSLQL
ncbi:DNA-methyltransferase [Bacillus atrophaeus]|uniref:DNA-methyltransferase n=1 Tax=Bacillus atrophaeus TaxID=1452 RepID=UPI0022802695|nr:site-specific DNA-methyltransferase [Bacillus atrophaeus]MCY8921156.1 site-specific DNA-methyltransferase [Bacillus atrophaeus]